MPHQTPDRIKYAALVVAGLSTALVTVAAFAASYTINVSRDRLANSQYESQNWLMMNGDCASSRYSRLTQINRDTVRNLRMVWALALGHSAFVFSFGS